MNQSYRPLILILVSIGIFYTFVLPQYTSLQQKMALASEYEVVVDNILIIKQKIDELMGTYQNIPQIEKDRLERILPDSVDAVGIARELDTIASRYGISVTGVQVNRSAEDGALIALPENGRPYDTATVSFSLISNYSNFMKFISDVEKSLRIMNVAGVSFKTNDAGIYEHQLTIETYWLK